MSMPACHNEYIKYDQDCVLIIKNRQGNLYQVFFDKEDYEKVSNYQFSARFDSSVNVLVIKCMVVENGKKTYRHFHQIVMGKNPLGLVTDHIDSNRLNNRKSNLQFITTRENVLKRKTRSKHRGVHWDKAARKYMSQITINNKHYFVGFYDCINLAQKAYYKKFYEVEGRRHPMEIA